VDNGKLDKIELKVDKLDSRLDKIDLHLAKYNSELEFHISRTTQLEDALERISKHVLRMQGAFNFIVLLSLLATVVAGISWLWTR
jgi:hypothetical protein